ncbi:Gfo/Idh/MocA family oxidoreductase [Microlunatus soli]|uniref:Predicted dehydrogenase n=1 Tax=Microlunatus soli TaxID=630515 RepID=A0A1H1R1M2_9ACTN|nr:hypothetical protein [Microlunatus soli]SDS29648.1 Predicted dehydrogenase [Microlunatus soli]
MLDRQRRPHRVLVLDGSPEGTAVDRPAAALLAGLDAHPAFELVTPGASTSWDPDQAQRQRVDLVVIAGPPAVRRDLINAVLGETALRDKITVLAAPVGARTADHPTADRLIPLYPQRYAPALRPAAAAVAGGRIGLPWSIQVDHLVSSDGPADSDDLIDQAAGVVDAVLHVLRLPVRTVYVPAGRAGIEQTLTVQCDHDHGVLSTIMVGRVPGLPGDSGFGDPVIRNRYRIAGSHGEVLVDGLRPQVRLTRATGRSARWDGPTALSGLLDAVAAGAGIPARSDIIAVQQVLDAARQSIRIGGPVDVSTES